MPNTDDPEIFILHLVKTDPFVSISEIRKEFIEKSGGEKISRWSIFRTLRRNKLLKRRARFRYAWGR